MKNRKKFGIALIFMWQLGNGLAADDFSFAPNFIAGCIEVREKIAKYFGSSGVVGSIENSIGMALSVRMIEKLESILMTNSTTLLVKSGRAASNYAIRQDKFFNAEEAKNYAEMMNLDFFITGKLDDDGKFKITGFSNDKNIHVDINIPKEELFYIHTGERLPNVPKGKAINIDGAIHDSAYSRDGDYAGIITESGGVYVFDSYREKPIKNIRKNGPLAKIKYGPLDEMVLAEESGSLSIIEDGKEQVQIKLSDAPLTSLEISDRGKVYTSYAHNVHVLDMYTKNTLFEFTVAGPVKGLFLTPNQEKLLVWDADGISWYNALTGIKDSGNIPNPIDAAAIGCKGHLAISRRNKILIYSIETKQLIREFRLPAAQPGTESGIISLSFSLNDFYVYAGTASGLLMTYDLRTGLCMHVLSQHIGALTTISQHSRQFLTAGADSNLFFYSSLPEPSNSLKIVNKVKRDVTILINGKRPEEGPVIPSEGTKIFSDIPLGKLNVTINNPNDLVFDLSKKRNAVIEITKKGNMLIIEKEPMPILDIDLEGRLIPSSLSLSPENLLSIVFRASNPTKSGPGFAPIVLLDINHNNSTFFTRGKENRKSINSSIWLGNIFVTAGEEGVWVREDNKFSELDSERSDNLSASDDNRYLVTSAKGRNAKLYKMDSLEFMHTIIGENAIFDGSSIVSVIDGKEVKRTDLVGANLPVFPRESQADSAVFAAEIASIKSGVNGIVLVSRKDGYVEVRNDGVGSPLIIPGTAAIQNKNGLLAVSKTNGSVEFYNINTGRLINTIFAHNGIITDLLFIGTEVLVTASVDGTTKIFNISSQKELAKFAIFGDRQKTLIKKEDEVFGDSLHVLKNGKRL